MFNILDYYLDMLNGFLHIFEILFLVSLLFVFKIKVNKLSYENKLKFYYRIKLILFIFLYIVFLINIYLVFDMFSTNFYSDISPTLNGIKLYFKGFRERLFPFLLTQVFVSVLCCTFYIWIHIKQRYIIKIINN